MAGFHVEGRRPRATGHGPRCTNWRHRRTLLRVRWAAVLTAARGDRPTGRLFERCELSSPLRTAACRLVETTLSHRWVQSLGMGTRCRPDRSRDGLLEGHCAMGWLDMDGHDPRLARVRGTRRNHPWHRETNGSERLRRCSKLRGFGPPVDGGDGEGEADHEGGG
jgi:hypothetical protein